MVTRNLRLIVYGMKFDRTGLINGLVKVDRKK